MGGGGGGGKSRPAQQAPVQTEPVEPAKKPETAQRDSGTAEQQRKKARAAAAARDTGTVLTGNLGTQGEANANTKKTVLGG